MCRGFQKLVNIFESFPRIGGFYPQNWMVKIMEIPFLKWMIWGYPYFGKHPFREPNCLGTLLRLRINILIYIFIFEFSDQTDRENPWNQMCTQ